MAEITPMMKQYRAIKEKAGDCILFFRLGDFYEMFDDDARLAAKELDLVLTTRDRGKDNIEDRIPMCGVPYHSSESYIARLLAKGYKVAICEQMEDPALAKGLVLRDIVRVITPGTVMDSSMLVESKPNYICSVYMDVSGAAACFAEISTGEFYVTAFEDDAAEHLANEIGRYQPSEAILNSGVEKEKEILELFDDRFGCLRQFSDEGFNFFEAAARLCEQFGVQDVDSLGLGDHPAAVMAAGGLLSYLYSTQKTSLKHIDKLEFYTSGRYMELSVQTRRNLELTETILTKERRGSLIWVLDKTNTPMGSRMLRSWLDKPLLSAAAIQRRLNAVEELFDENVRRGELMKCLKGIGDIERLTGRIVYGNANCKDLAALALSLRVLPKLFDGLEGMKSQALAELRRADPLCGIEQKISDALVDDPPFSLREGGLFRKGYNEEIDRLRDLAENGRGAIANIESRERERTGIKKLRINYNKVFGYYIEVPRSQVGEVPDDYIRKQTLTNGERYITEELKELESTLITAREQLHSLEYSEFIRLRDEIAEQSARLKQTAAAVSKLDVLCALAETAVKNDYCMPKVDMSSVIDIRDGRHPVVEKMGQGLFVANDTYLNSEAESLAVITGPNMAGKSTYMRQTALIVLMAQMGSFVPARSAQIGIADCIFTRIGASDDLAGGKSTFMVEMTEIAEILKNATHKSFIIMDEIGRGTSTYDGMAIAKAVVEYCADKKKLGARTMFATHYHELTALEDELPGVKNYNIAAKKRGDDIIFLRRIVPGGADESYGVEVAKLAGVPDGIIKRAKEVLAELEAGRAVRTAVRPDEPREQVSMLDLGAEEVTRKLRETAVETLTPIEAMNLLYELKKKLM